MAETEGLLGNKNVDDGSEDDFGNDRPAMQKQERPFSLAGQGRPIAELSEYTNSNSSALVPASTLAARPVSGNSEDDFANERPQVSQNERVFNLSGQGKPMAELAISNSTDM